MLICGWSEEKRRDQLLQSKSIVLSTIDTDQSMIGNINKGKDRRRKENCRFSFYSFCFCRVQPGHSLGILQSFRRDSFRAIATYADSSPTATERFVSGWWVDSKAYEIYACHSDTPSSFSRFDLAWSPLRLVTWCACTGIRSAAFSSCDLASRRKRAE